MAIKFSLPQKKQKNKNETTSNTNPPAFDVDAFLNDTPTKAPTTATTTPKKSKLSLKHTPKSTNEKQTNSVARKTDKKTLMMAGVLGVLAVLAVLYLFVLPMFQAEEPTPVATVATPAPIAKPVASPASTASAVAPVATTDNLRTETVVISGEQLGNTASAPASSTMPTAVQVDNSETQKALEKAQPVESAPPAPEVKAEQKLMEKSSPSKENPRTKAQGSMSYADFVKASEQQVFADR